MGPLLVLDCAPCSAGNRRSDPATQIEEWQRCTVENYGRPLRRTSCQNGYNSPSSGVSAGQRDLHIPRQVDLSTATVCARSDSHNLAILDWVECRPSTSEVDASNDVQSLAQVMSNLAPVTCSLLRCEGVECDTNETGRLRGFSLALQMPPSQPSLSNDVVPSRKNNDRSTVDNCHTGGYVVIFADICPDGNPLSAKLTTPLNACSINQLLSRSRKKHGACWSQTARQQYCRACSKLLQCQ